MQNRLLPILKYLPDPSVVLTEKSKAGSVFESVEPDYYEAGTAPLREKREALKALYRIETGTEYD